MKNETEQPETRPQSDPKKIDWLRWTIPPGISIGVHAILIGGVAYIGMQISAAQTPSRQLPMAELALPAPIERTATTTTTNTPTAGDPSPAQSSTPTSPNQLDLAAANLGTLEYTKPAMDPVALAALRSSNAQIAKPESASPPVVEFAGVQTQAARTIVYVVDGSGATANSFSYLQTQLMRSIDRLSPTQRFQVVLFRSFDGHTITAAPINNNTLARATAANKQLVNNWLETINTRGRSNPVEGLRAALAIKPDLVMLITRSIKRTEMGWAQGQQAILQELNTLNPQDPITGDRRTTIKTIQLLDEDPTGIMRAIGMLHGGGANNNANNKNGGYQVVTYDDLISTDEPELSTRSIGASNEQRISSASEIMATLTQSGTSFALFYAYGDLAQQERAREGASRVRSLIRPLAQADGRAAILDAQALLLRHISGSPVDEQQLQAIVNALEGVLYTEPNTDAQRVLTVALALAQLGQPEQAHKLVKELLDIADDLGLNESTRAQTMLALVSLGEANDRYLLEPPFVTPAGSIDAVWGLLLRETMTKAKLSFGQPDPWEPMTTLRRQARKNESISNHIDTRIALILRASGAPQLDTALPGEVLLAAANSMSHSISQRSRAIELYSEIAQRDNPQQAGDALWQIGVLGRAVDTPESEAQSAAALIELCTHYRDHPRARDAIAGAILATPKHQESTMRDRLRLAVDQYPDHPQIDLWRLDLAELLTSFEALSVLDPITANTREGVLAGELYEQIVIGMLDQLTDAQIRRGLEIRMRDAAIKFGIPGASLWTTRAARSQASYDPQAAVGSLDQLIREAKKENKPTHNLELMRAQTLEKLGRSQSAFEALSALTSQMDATGNHTSTYWRAWALMLEAVIANGSAQDKLDALGHITRLELIDPNLGGSPWRQRIIEARQTLH